MNQPFDDPDDLSPQDKQLLDALIEHEFDVRTLGPLSSDQRARIDRIMQIFSLLDDYPVEEPDETLVNATLLRIRQNERATHDARRLTTDGGLRIEPDAEVERVAGGRRLQWGPMRFPDFISIAAVILIVAGVTIPVLSHMRQRSIDLNCVHNMQQVGYGLVRYADDHGGQIPTIAAGLGLNGRWVNLSPLVSYGYCEDGHANCPGHHQPLQPGFSFQLQRPDERRFLLTGGSDTAILSDRNPVLDAARVGVRLAPLTNSHNHNGRGQNILMSDGSTLWRDVPIYKSSDNIWFPPGVDNLFFEEPPPDPWRGMFFGH